ncbi:hypothetical protein BU17DRAFT_71095 [Hysterangium stoloniferum]|nr:hypothetical protein BU17DRAFT_71095 [Hysterangium stoloniferum]
MFNIIYHLATQNSMASDNLTDVAGLIQYTKDKLTEMYSAIQGYLQTAALTFFLYDYLLTFPTEIEYLWKRQIKLVSLCFLLARYFGVVAFLIQVIVRQNTPQWRFRGVTIWNDCGRGVQSHFYAFSLAFLIVQTYCAVWWKKYGVLILLICIILGAASLGPEIETESATNKFAGRFVILSNLVFTLMYFLSNAQLGQPEKPQTVFALLKGRSTVPDQDRSDADKIDLDTEELLTFGSPMKVDGSSSSEFQTVHEASHRSPELSR